MRPALLAFLLALGAPRAEEPRAFVEVEAAKGEAWVGERVRVTLRFGVEAGLLREGAVPISLRRLDFPALVEAPWIEGLPGGDAADGATFALNDGVARALRDREESRDGLAFRVLEIERTLPAEAPGEILLGGTALRLAVATRFEEDAFGTRVPLDRRAMEARAPDLRIRVLPLPAEGRPPGFAGAVGRFSVSATCADPEAAVGGSVQVRIDLEGEGNPGSLRTPPPGWPEGFHVRGLAVREGREGRSLTFDLSPLAEGVAGIPPFPFPHFDPGPPAGYRVARTGPIPLRVLPGPDAEREEDAPFPRWAIAAAAALAILGVLAARRRRARARAAGEEIATGIAAAAARFRARAGEDLGGAFAEFLGAKMGLPAAAAIAPDLADRLAASGVPGPIASRAARLLDLLVGARYGGSPPGTDAAAEAHALVEEIAAGAPVRLQSVSGSESSRASSPPR